MRNPRLLLKIGIAVGPLAALICNAGAARANDPMYIEACVSADCTDSGNRPPPNKAFIWAGTVNSLQQIWIGTWNKTTKKWSNVGISYTDQYGEYASLFPIFSGCGTTQNFVACDLIHYDCSKWNGQPNAFVSNFSPAKVRCN